MKNSIKKSFTLMELLVVVAIIGVLVAITIPAINVARAKARDAKRIEDLRSFSFALEQYYENHQQYPAWEAGGGFQDNGGDNPLKVLVDEKMISSLPQDPLISKYVYYYITTDNGQTYKTVAYMEQDKQKAEKDGGTASTYYEAFTYPPGKQQAQLTDAELDEAMPGYVSPPPPWVCGDTITDIRDGRVYATVLIGTQCWFKQGLNVGTRIDGGSNQGTDCSSASAIQKYCYNDDEANCNSNNNPNYPDGGLYQWNQAMCGSTSPGAQGICPPGWHFPTDEELVYFRELFKRRRSDL